MVLLALPKYAVLKNKYNSKILSLRKDDKYLSFTGESVLSPEAKFAIEPASNGNGQVHVRSAYNNRYFIRNSSGFVVAGAAQPEEDTTKETCTLFTPLTVNDGDSTSIRFNHVQSGNYARLNYSGDASNVHDACLYAVYDSSDSYLRDACEVIDWEALMIFPLHDIAFKGDNDCYLSGRIIPMFDLDNNTSLLASFRVEPVGDGSIQIYSNYCSRYLSFNNYYINAERIEKSPNDPKALFWPVKLDSNVIALRSLSNNKYITRTLTPNEGIFGMEYIYPHEEVITKECHITVEELVISRSRYNIVYRHDDARVYDETPIVCGKGDATNNSHGEDTMQIPIKYKEAKSTRWDDSVSLKVGASTSFETGVPFIAKGQIKFEMSVTGGHKWGETDDKSFDTGITYIATIPPKTRVEVNYVATKGTCDIPFSYTVADVYSDGTRKLTINDDGLYTGVNCYNFDFVKTETPLE